MKKRIVNYRTYIDELLANAPKDTDWEGVLKEHLTQISFFQHERLIHLIVTVTFAVLTMLSVGIGLMTDIAQVFLLTVFLLILLIPYIGHYYILENEVQKMYAQYDSIWKLCQETAR